MVVWKQSHVVAKIEYIVQNNINKNMSIPCLNVLRMIIVLLSALPDHAEGPQRIWQILVVWMIHNLY
jgi:hypothetical protein